MVKKRRGPVKPILALVFGLFLTLPALAGEQCTAVYGTGAHTFSLASGSPGELGILEAMAEVFNPQHDTRLCWQKAGSGKSLQLLKEKQVDMVIVHAPAAEKQAVKEGQSLIRSFGTQEYGEGLYNDAAYAKQYDH
ncbi:MAG: substrate-binding domain-containing protein [Desulfobacterales bacterium]|nr:MAG: substrate-binding domain-containing protein [Desulfobacterales bacterium]